MDMDFDRFTGLQWTCLAAVIAFIGLVASWAMGSPIATGAMFWTALAAGAGMTFFAAVFVSYPRKDGSWRGLGESPEK